MCAQSIFGGGLGPGMSWGTPAEVRYHREVIRVKVTFLACRCADAAWGPGLWAEDVVNLGALGAGGGRKIAAMGDKVIVWGREPCIRNPESMFSCSFEYPAAPLVW